MFLTECFVCRAHGFPNNMETYGLISGLWTSTFAFGAFIGPSVAGILYDTVGFRNSTLFVVICAGVVVSRLFTLRLGQHGRIGNVSEVRFVTKKGQFYSGHVIHQWSLFILNRVLYLTADKNLNYNFLSSAQMTFLRGETEK